MAVCQCLHLARDGEHRKRLYHLKNIYIVAGRVKLIHQKPCCSEFPPKLTINLVPSCDCYRPRLNTVNFPSVSNVSKISNSFRNYLDTKCTFIWWTFYICCKTYAILYSITKYLHSRNTIDIMRLYFIAFVLLARYIKLFRDTFSNPKIKLSDCRMTDELQLGQGELANQFSTSDVKLT